MLGEGEARSENLRACRLNELWRSGEVARTRAPAGVGWNGQGHFKIFAHGSEAGRACGSAIVYGACVWRANHVVVVLHKMAG